MRNDTRGSLWRQWDFHFHTPASFDHQNKGLSDADIVKHLIDAGLSAVVITDHHVMDVARIKNMQSIAGDRLAVFPGIELRSELGGRTCVHYIGIFPDTCDIEQLWTNLQGQLKLHPNDVIASGGDERFYVPFAEGARCIKSLGGLLSIHAGKKSNSIEEICGAVEFKQQVKTDMLVEFVDFLEVGQVKDVDDYKNIVFPAINKRLPIIICSDNHNSAKYHRKAPCWIKADLTFDGLRHLIHEPDDRVCVKEVPPLNKRVSENRTKYIESIKIQKNLGAKCPEEWFKAELPLNSGLVAVIGNKGSGKSALADILGLLGDSSNGDHFSFLHRDRFRQPKDNKAQHFSATIQWHSGGSATRGLHENVPAGAIESVRYLPQAYLERICNGLGEANSGPFSDELKSVIFSHVKDPDRLGFTSLDDILNHKNIEANHAIQLLRNELEVEITKLLRLESEAGPVHRTALTQKIAAKQRELATHLATPIPVIPKPQNTPEIQQKIAETEEHIASLGLEQDKLNLEVSTLVADSTNHSRRVAAADRLMSRITTLQLQFDKFVNDSSEDCSQLGLSIAEIATLSFKTEPIVTKKTTASAEKARIDSLLNETNPVGIPAKISTISSTLAEHRKNLDRPNQIHQQYLLDQAEWDNRKVSIEGDLETPDSLKFLEHQLLQLESLPAKIEAGYVACLNLSLRIHEHILGVAEVYRSFYRPVQQFIERHALADKHFHLSFEATIADLGFSVGMLKFISHSKAGSFCGVADGTERANQLARVADFDSGPGLSAFLESVIQCLRFDTRSTPAIPIQVQEQLGKGKDLQSLLNFVFGLSYLVPSYSLRWAGKEIKELSPGERGTLLLVFYLLIDVSDIPLIIDQPEENLDNQTVFDILVPSIKEAKSRRQIIMVTHNPNIAVVCDADQIIYAAIDKSNANRIAYVTGSIENREVNRRLVDILEGTWPAFNNRGRKYGALDAS